MTASPRAMVERLARALCAHHYRNRSGKPTLGPRAQLIEMSWPQFVAAAEMMLAELREPSQEMLDAGTAAYSTAGSTEDLAARVWRAMIAIAIADEPPTPAA